MIWLALLLTASLVASVTSGDGQPPVTIIEIPGVTYEIEIATTTVTASSVAPPESSVLTTSPASSTSSPQIADQVIPTARRPFRLWDVVAVLAVGVLLVLAPVRLRRNRVPAGAVATAIPLASPPIAVSPSVLGHYEAIEYRSEAGTT